MYIQELERITTWVKMGEDEKKWASKVGLVGLLELKWITPRNEWLVEFLNTYQIQREIIFARLGEKFIIINKHLIVDMFKFSNKGWNKQKQAKAIL
jgi:hypothetical protein